MKEINEKHDWVDDLNTAVNQLADPSAASHAPPPLPPLPELRAEPPALPEEAIGLHETEPPSLARSMIQPAKWSIVGFALGLALWSLIGIWGHFDDTLTAAQDEPSPVELALRDKAVAALEKSKRVKDQSTVPYNEKIANEERTRRCVALELDRREKRISERPCEAAQDGWSTTAQAVTAASN